MRLPLSLLLPTLPLVAACASTSPAPVATPATPVEVATPAAAPAPAPTLIDRLAGFLIGQFDSADQAKGDPSFFAIQLRVCPVEAPALGARVLYVEQAAVESLAQPYRQRLYVLEQVDATHARSRVFELADPSKTVGLCDDPAVQARFDPAGAIERAGCAVELTWDGQRFVGGTVGQGCESTLRGAAYATSEVTLDQDGLRSWDRGFDRAGTQVWGARAGAYVFVRRPTPGA